jgi:mannosyltransferase
MRWRAALPWLLLGGIALLGVVLAWREIGSEGFAVDEGSSYWLASLPAGDFWEVVSRSEANASLYYLLLRAWTSLGQSEAFIRGFSIVFAVATVVPLFMLVRRLAGDFAGLAAALLLIVNGYWLEYARFARGYALAMFLATLTTYLLLRMLDGDARRTTWVAYGVLMGLSLYAHMFSLLVLGAHVLVVLLTRPVRPARRRFVAAFGVVGLFLIPLLAFLLFSAGAEVDWLRSPTPGRVVTRLTQFVGNAGLPLLLAHGALLGVVVARWLAALRERDTEPRGWHRYTLVLAWLLVPIVGGIAVSVFKPLFHSRYLIVAFPALAATAALGIDVLRPKMLQVGALAGVAVLAATAVPAVYDENPKHPWRELTGLIAENAREGDRVVFFSPTTRRTVEYYVESRALETTFPEPIYPAGEWGAHPIELVPFVPDMETLNREVPDAERVWFVSGLTTGLYRDQVAEAIARACPQRTGTWFRGRLIAYECGTDIDA